MAKADFYFPLFYQRLVTSTTGWPDEAFGVYLRLLIYQYDQGAIPADMASICEIAPAAKKHWPRLQKKFVPNNAGGLVNLKMDEVRKNREEKFLKNTENGGKGGRPKKQKEKPFGFENETENKPNGFEENNQMVLQDKPDGSEKKTYPILVNGFGYSGEENEGAGEKETPPLLIPQMHRVWCQQHPKYTSMVARDYPELLLLYRGLTADADIEHPPPGFMQQWQVFAAFVAVHPFFNTYSLQQVNRHLQSILNEQRNPKPPVSSTKQSGTAALAGMLDERLKAYG